MHEMTNESDSPPQVDNPLTFLREHLADFAARCRAARWFGALFHVRVADDIMVEVVQRDEQIVADAYSAEQYDIEAAKLIEDAARDGLTQCDMPAVAKAIRLIRASARKDHNIKELARA